MLCATYTRTVQPYAYGTCTTIRVWYRKTHHYMRMVRTIRVRYVPYAYGMKYAYGTQHGHHSADDKNSGESKRHAYTL